MSEKNLRINPKELRIGNIVDYFDESLDEWFNNFEIEDLYKYDDDCYEGIKLTKQMLKSCGFIEKNIDKEIAYYLFNEVEIFKDDDGIFYFVCDAINVKLTYLHQLQNLYFILKNEELFK